MIIVSLLLILNLVEIFSKQKDTVNDAANATNYTQFLKDVQDGKVSSVVILEKSRGLRDLTVTPKEGKEYIFTPPSDSSLVSQLVTNGIKITTKKEPEPSAFMIF